MAVAKIKTMKKVIKTVFGIMAVTMLLCGCENSSDLSTGKSDKKAQTKETGSSSSEADPKESSDLGSEGMVSDLQEKFISEEEAK